MGVPELIAAVQKGDINEVKSLIGKGKNLLTQLVILIECLECFKVTLITFFGVLAVI